MPCRASSSSWGSILHLDGGGCFAMLKVAKLSDTAMAGSKKRQAMPTHTWLGRKLPRAIGRPWGGLQAPGRSHAGYSHLATRNLWGKEHNRRHEFANVAKLLLQTPTDPCSSRKSWGSWEVEEDL